MKKEKYFQLNQAAVEALAEKYGTPLLVLSLEQIEKIITFCALICRALKYFTPLRPIPTGAFLS